MYHHEPVCRVLTPSVLEYLIRTLSVDVVVVVVICIVVVVVVVIVVVDVVVE